MKTKTTTATGRHCKPQRWSRGVGFLAVAFLCSLGLDPQADAQSYSLSNAWTIANGTAHVGNNGGFNRGVAYDAVSNQVFVASRSGASTGFIDVFDGTSGALLSGSGGIAGANLGIDQIGEGDDGVLYGAPLATSISSTTGSLTVYSWTNWFNNSTPYAAYKSASGDAVVANFAGKRIGDSLAVIGSGVNTLILLAVGPGCTNFVLLHTTDGMNFTPTAVLVTSVLPGTGTGGGGNICGITFYTNNTFLVMPGANASSHNVFLVSYPANFASQSTVTGTVLGSAAPGALAVNLTTAINYAPAGNLLAVAQIANQSVNTNAIFSMTNFTGSIGQLAGTNFATPNANGNATGAAALGGTGRTNFLYVLESNNGLQAYAINFSAAPQPPNITTAPVGISGAFPPYNLSVAASGTAPLAYQWLASNTISATFTNIPGANTNVYAVTTAATNFYEVIITNSVNAVTSTPVRVALLTPVISTVVTQQWRVAAGAAGYPFLGTDGTTRGLGYDAHSQRLVVANNAGAIYILDAGTGTNLGTMNMSGISGGTFPIDQVVVADDSAVYAGNLATSGSQIFTLYRWSGPTNTVTPTVAYGDSGTLQGTGDRWGDTMAVRGSGANTQILLASRSGTNVALLTTGDGMGFSASIIPVTGVPGGFSGLGITFGDGNTFWSKTSGGGLFKVAFDPVGLTGSVVFDYTTPGQIPSSLVGVGVDPVNNLLAGIVLNDVPQDLQLFQLTGTSDAPVLFDQAFFASANANGNGSVAIAMKFPHVFGLDANNGLLALTYGTPPTTVPTINTPPASQTAYTNIPSVTFGASVSGSLPLYYQWQFSLTTNDAGFGNLLSGTNSTYTLTHPPLSAAGYYRVIVHNIAGFATSAPPALLTLIVPTTSVVVTQLWTLPAGSFSFLDGSSYNTRGLAYDTNSGIVLVADNGNLHLLAATNGSYFGDLNSAGVFNGGYNNWLFDQIGVASDGTLYAANLTLSGSAFSIVSWSPGYGPGSAASGYAYGGGTGGDPGSGSGDRWGDTMSVRGSGTGTEILIGSYSGTNVVLFTTADGFTFTPLLIPVANVPAGFSGQGIAFGSSNTFWAKSPSYNLRQIAFDPTGATPASVLQVFTAGTQFPSSFDGIDVDAAANILGGVNFSDVPNDLQLFLLSGNTNPPALFDQAFFGSMNANAQLNAVTTLKSGLGFSLDVNNGLTAVSYGLPNAPGVTLISVAYAPGNVTLTWNNAFTGHSYQVQYKDHLLDATWTNLGSPVPTTGNTTSYTDSTARGATRFYRVITE